MEVNNLQIQLIIIKGETHKNKNVQIFLGYINKILSAPVLYPFSRVTYCAYLIHPIIIRLTAMNLDSPFHLGKDTVVSLVSYNQLPVTFNKNDIYIYMYIHLYFR